MKSGKPNRFLWLEVALIALVLAATAACGAAVNGKDGAAAPLDPVTYDPRVSLSPLVERVSPAVVNIRATAKARMGQNVFDPGSLFEWFFGPGDRGENPFYGSPPESELEQRALGSGFIVEADGLVVTNRHVVEQADDIEVQLTDDRTFKAEVVGSDARTDVALLRLKDAKGLPTVSWGESDEIKVGDHVVAIGNPFGLDHTVTSGIVSAKERVIGAGPYDDFIQTDASINPGNSGGPLFNLKGEVIGINTAISPQGQGIGFAIPSKLARTVIESLIDNGKVVRGWLGINFQPLDEDLAKAFKIGNRDGVVVTNVQPDSPADKGGVESGDIVVEVAGKKIKNAEQLPSMVAALKPGEKVELGIVRDGKPKNLEVEIGELTDDLGGAAAGEKLTADLGFGVAEPTGALKEKLDAENVKGVVVTEISPESAAAAALRPGDVIVSVNRQNVENPEQFASATKDLGPGDEVLLHVHRNGGWLYLVLKL